MNEFRRLAAKIEQHMQQLAAQGVSEPHAIINRMILKTSVTPPGLHAESANEGVPVVRWPRWCA